MRKVKNRVILILIIIVVAIFIIGMIYFITRGESVNDEKIVEMQDDGSKLNIGSKLHEKKEIDGFTIENVSFIEKEGVTELRADVTNKTGETKDGFLMDIVLYDEKGKEIGRIPGNVIETKAGETIQICAGITGIVEEYVKANDFKIEKK